jgi:hypothetical protein
MVKVGKLFGIVFVLVLLLQVFLFSAVAYSDTWVSKRSIPIELVDGGCVTTSDGMIYAISGNGNNVMYNPTTDTWTSKASMPTNRTHFGIASYENKIYVIGGSGEQFRVEGSAGSTTNINEVYDTEKDTWETKASMPTDRENFSANAVNGKIYVAGGYKNGMGLADIGYRFDINYVYDISTDTWSNKTSPPQNVDVYRSVVIDDKIHLLRAGSSLFGPISNAELSQHMIYEVKTDVWSFGALMPTPVIGDPEIGAIGATVGDLAPKRIYAIGGGSKGDLVQVYDPESDTWSTGSSMPVSRSGFSVAVVADLLYVIGGYDSDGCASAANDMYIPLGYNTSALPPDSNTSPKDKLVSIDIVLVTVVAVVLVSITVAIVFRFKKGKHKHKL